MPTTSSPERTDARPSSQDDSTTVAGGVRQLVDVVAEPRPVGQLDRGEQRVVAGVPAVAGEVQDVDLRGQVRDLGGDGAFARQHRRAGPGGRCPRDLLLRPLDVRPGDQAHPRPTVPSRPAQLQPAGRGRRHGDRASGEAREQRPGGARQLARRRQHDAAVADQRQHRSDEQVRDDLEPFVQRAPDRGGEGSRQLGGGHVEVGGDPVEVLADGLRLAQADGVGLRAGHDDRGDPPVDRDVRHQAGVGGGQLGLHLLERRGLADLAAPVAVPALLTDPVAQLVETAAVRRARRRGRRRTAPAAR